MRQTEEREKKVHQLETRPHYIQALGQDARTFPQPSPESMQRPPRWVIVGPAHHCVHLLLHNIGRPCRTHIINTSSGLSSKGGVPTQSPCRSNSMRQMSQPISKRLRTPSAPDGSCLGFFCVCVCLSLFFMRVCVSSMSLSVSCSLSIWLLRILTSGRKSVHTTLTGLVPSLAHHPSPLPYRLAREIADRRLQNVRSPIAVH